MIFKNSRIPFIWLLIARVWALSFALITDSHLVVDRPTDVYSAVVAGALALAPEFVVLNGDLVGKPTRANFAHFANASAPLVSALGAKHVHLVNGNHDTGVNSAASAHPFLEMQHALNGRPTLYYSFDAHGWHFIIFPTIAAVSLLGPRAKTQMMHWLRADVERTQTQPTMVFAHYHFMPQRLSQLEYYAESVTDRRKLLAIVLRHRNVRYWFAGHVHNGALAAEKIAWRYRNCTFITLPSVVGPRGYGEEYPELANGAVRGGYYTQVLAATDGGAASLIVRQIDSTGSARVLDLSAPPEFAPAVERRWLRLLIDAPPLSSLGKLSQWNRVLRYSASSVSAQQFECRVRNETLTLKVRGPSLAVDGGAWRSDELIEVYQVVTADGAPPSISFELLVQRADYGGGYIRLHYYSARNHTATHVHYWGERPESSELAVSRIFAYTANGSKRLSALANVEFYALYLEPSAFWQNITVAVGSPFPYDRVAVIIGVWARVKNVRGHSVFKGSFGPFRTAR